MPTYTPPLRDMQFVLHELLKVSRRAEGACRAHAEIDADTINAVLEEGGKFAAEVTFPLNQQRRRARAARSTRPRHEVTTPDGLQGGLRAVRRRRLAGAVAATRRTAARACRSC